MNKAEEFIEKNYETLWSMCGEASSMMFPLKKSYGYGIDSNLMDEQSFIYDDLMVPLIERYFDDGVETWDSTEFGWYRVILEEYDNELNISILFSINDKCFDI